MTKPEILELLSQRVLAYWGKEIFKKTRKERHEITKEVFRRFLEHG